MTQIDCLDHGYLRLIESWGSDERVVESARMSTGKGFLGWGPIVTGLPCLPNGMANGRPREPLPGFIVDIWRSTGRPAFQDATNPYREVREDSGDEKLLAYLYDNKHSTPFEMAGLVVEVKAPISVFRQWHRHRVWAYNEMSARYTPLPNENYVPTVERLLINSKANKQAGMIKGAYDLTPAMAEAYRQELIAHYAADEEFYQRALQMGVPKELAREHLPVGRYSAMRGSANLRNCLAFLTLRMDEHAQYEIRVFANALATIVEEKFPRTYALFARGSA